MYQGCQQTAQTSNESHEGRHHGRVAQRLRDSAVFIRDASSSIDAMTRMVHACGAESPDVMEEGRGL